MLISRKLYKKSSEVSIKTSSSPPSFSFKDQATKHITVKMVFLGFKPFITYELLAFKLYLQYPCKSIQAVTNSYVNCFSKYTIATLQVCDNLSVSTTHVQDSGVNSTCHKSSHLNMSNTMIDSHHRFLPQLSNCPCYYGNSH